MRNPIVHAAAPAAAAAAAALLGGIASATPTQAATYAASSTPAATRSAACPVNVPNRPTHPTTTVNLRSKASASSTSLGLLHTSDWVTIRCTNSSGSWDVVTVTSGPNDGRTGWVKDSYLSAAMCLPEDEACHNG